MENFEIAQINSGIWSVNSRKVLQILHGASENIERYEEFALFLNAHGIDVVAHNHEGHGILEEGKGVVFKLNNEEKLLKDSIIIYDYLHLNYDEVYVLGHSMGSFILRNILTHNLDYKKVIFTGTGYTNKFLLFFLKCLIVLFSKIQGNLKINNFLNKLVFKDLVNKLTHDETLKQAYIDSIYCGQQFSNGALYGLVCLVQKANSKELVKTYNKNSKYLNAYGTLDPIAKQNKQFVELLKDFDLTTIKYEQNFHEILNETNKEEVYQDILKFLTKE